MASCVLLVLTWAVAASAEEPPPETSSSSPFALSVGTGPRPLNTLTLGLTGLGARVMFPLGRAVPFVGLSANSFTASSFEDGEKDQRYVSGATSVHGSGGIRYDLAERKGKAVVPYLIGGALAGYAGTRGGYPGEDEWFKVGTFTVGVLAGLGFDGFVTPHLSLGGELGGIGALSMGSSRDVEGGNVDDEYGKVDTTVLTSFTALQLTVWR